MKRTYQPSKRRRKTTHGFRRRSKDRVAKLVLTKRRRKGRKRIAV
ncbi:MAG: 50S ribosomal protein L34 [Candidatus Nealsonbacteria bacterium CG23_combo_of_CG06-09_8_20_14_all_40_13]|uniref:Large ribosomal subunit protein bL34 n=1 Tax=Candidatus Nealsonbacteria bacterium CG23_combo_of_CG06-09_8_20_14_all_40_13 TaxID=1974724 RepID=A0A2G9YQI0_9BACT|nr:MAG: 50S ribosomal protein L34 [Candidatus Nealsonbacteria bacterium CG23_combo_of_CG06-09_8_20_14_all_40_13]PIR71131.1 MAG: 50S ribosomal protein L34 [Candidatus Nealsonbacteria bacterium CG10_big_fil_rev_8_21_14_0_10_40_24]PIU43266.1 MAG: 50S ribosomal protein L34 [Candidatus Nealsonbacteria bacterium CG07_land_8_20_14_0_80_40_10]